MTKTTPPRPDVYYGGQAVMEGVMIRGPEHMAVAVRHPKGHIVRHSEKLTGLYTGNARKVPLLRGVLVLWETLSLGMRALTFSSRVVMEEDDDEGQPTEFPEKLFWGTMAVALIFAIGIFFAAPILLAHLLEFADAPRWLIVAGRRRRAAGDVRRLHRPDQPDAGDPAGVPVPRRRAHDDPRLRGRRPPDSSSTSASTRRSTPAAARVSCSSS